MRADDGRSVVDGPSRCEVARCLNQGLDEFQAQSVRRGRGDQPEFQAVLQNRFFR